MTTNIKLGQKKEIRVPEIKVKNSGIVRLQYFDDFPDGLLAIGENNKTIPFTIKRFYFTTNLSRNKSTRGKHAHHKTDQVIFCISGSFTLNMDDGQTKQSILVNDPRFGIRIGPMLWHSMNEFSPDCVIFVVSNSFFEEKDYIRDYSAFTSLIKKE